MSFVAKDGNGDSVTFASQNIGGIEYPNKYMTDGHLESLGAKADTAATSDTGTFSLISLFKRLLQSITTFSAKFANGAGLAATAVRVELPTDGTGKVGLNTGSNTIGAVNLAEYTPSSGKLPVLASASDTLLTSIETKLSNLSMVEDVAAPGSTTGIGVLAIRNSAPANLSNANGDWEHLQVSAGRLWTASVIDDNGGSITVDAPVSAPVYVRLSNGVSAISTLPVSAASLPLPSGAATETSLSSIASILNDNIYDALNSASHAEDSASANLDKGFATMVVRKATPANTSDADGDYEMLQVNAGRLWTSASIEDGGNSITVDAPTGTPVNVQIGDGARQATVRDTGSSDSLNVAIVDASGNHITSFGGGSQYTEGDTDASITGTAVLWEDTSDTLSTISAAKPLPVNVVAGGAGDGSILDGVSSSIKATVLDYTNSNPLAVRLTDTAGDYVGAGAGTQYTEDAAAAADPIGTMSMAVRADSLSAVTTTDGDNIALRATNKGELYVKHTDSIPAGTNNIGDVDVLSVPAPLSTTGGGTQAAALRVTIATDSTGVLSIDDNGDSLTVDGAVSVSNASLLVEGTVEHDSADVGYPLLIGAYASSSEPSGVSEGNAVRLWSDLRGRLQIGDGNDSLSVDDGGGAITVDGTITANAGTNLNTSALALETGGNLASIATSASLLDDAIVADDAAFTPATTKVMMAGFEFDDSATDSVNEGDAGAARMSANRVIYMQIRDAAGNERGANVDSSNRLSTIETNSATIAGYLAGIPTSILTDTPIGPPADSLLGTAISTLTAVSDVNTTIGTGNGYLSTIATNTTGEATSLAIIDDWDESDRAKVNPIVGQAGVQGGSGAVSNTTQRVVLATDVALPTGSNAIGKLAANSGVDIGDVDITSIAAGSNTIGNTKDAGPSWTSAFGVSGARFTSSNASGAAAAVSDAPTGGQKIVVTDVLVSVDTAMRVDVKEETSGTTIASLYMPANSMMQWTPRSKTKLATADKKLMVQTSASGNIAVTAHYYSEA